MAAQQSPALAVFAESDIGSEKWAQRKDGVEIPVETSLAAWELQGERLCTAIVRDVTKRLQAEEKARRYTDQLEEANHRKDLFTDILHHDLMNPAGVVLSLAELLLEREGDRRRRGILIGIRDSSRKLMEMIERAALYAKLSNRNMIERQTIDLDEVLRKPTVDISCPYRCRSFCPPKPARRRAVIRRV